MAVSQRQLFQSSTHVIVMEWTNNSWHHSLFSCLTSQKDYIPPEFSKGLLSGVNDASLYRPSLDDLGFSYEIFIFPCWLCNVGLGSTFSCSMRMPLVFYSIRMSLVKVLFENILIHVAVSATWWYFCAHDITFLHSRINARQLAYIECMTYKYWWMLFFWSQLLLDL